MRRLGGGALRMFSSGMSFLLLGIFALLSALLVMTAAQAYHGVVQAAEAHAQARILSNYAVSQARLSGRARVEDGGRRLALQYGEGEDAYETYIYCHAGALCEVTLAAGDEFLAEDGQGLYPASSFTASMADACLTVTVVGPTGVSYVSAVALDGEVAP